MQITIENIPIEVKYKKIKNLNLTIKHNPDMVILSMPKNSKLDSGIKFVNSKLSWIKKHLQDTSIYNRPINFETDKFMYVFGNKYPIIKNESEILSIRFDKENIYINYPKDTEKEKIINLVNKFYKKLLSVEIDSKLYKWEKQLDLYSSKYYIRTMTSKWGSCNIKTKRLCFNSNLAKYPIDCLDYLIVHELAHIKYPNHNKSFYDFVEKHYKNYKTIRKILKT